MKTATELYEEWTDGEKSGMRPKRVQELRDDLAEATGMTIPRRVSAIEGWLDTMRSSGVITRKLKKAASEVESSDGSDDE